MGFCIGFNLCLILEEANWTCKPPNFSHEKDIKYQVFWWRTPPATSLTKICQITIETSLAHLAKIHSIIILIMNNYEKNQFVKISKNYWYIFCMMLEFSLMIIIFLFSDLMVLLWRIMNNIFTFFEMFFGVWSVLRIFHVWWIFSVCQFLII